MLDEAHFRGFDTSGDGKVSLAEFQANLHPSARAKICEKVNAGWRFDAERWAQAEDTSTFGRQDALSHYAAQAKVDLPGLAHSLRALHTAHAQLPTAHFHCPRLAQRTRTPAALCTHCQLCTTCVVQVDLRATFAQFDTNSNGSLDMREFMRAFRALGLSKRSGEKLTVDEAMFRSFDQNDDGVVTLAELEQNLGPKVAPPPPTPRPRSIKPALFPRSTHALPKVAIQGS